MQIFCHSHKIAVFLPFFFRMFVSKKVVDLLSVFFRLKNLISRNFVIFPPFLLSESSRPKCLQFFPPPFLSIWWGGFSFYLIFHYFFNNFFFDFFKFLIFFFGFSLFFLLFYKLNLKKYINFKCFKFTAHMFFLKENEKIFISFLLKLIIIAFHFTFLSQMGLFLLIILVIFWFTYSFSVFW